MPSFCESCERVLSRDTTSGSIIFTCKCGQKYKPTPKDTLIKSSFTQSNGFDMNIVLRFATQDRVNYQEDIKCPACNKLYMTLVGTEAGYWFKCECGKLLNGDRTEAS